MKICFACDVHYGNYTKRIQESALKCFLDFKLYEYDIHYYISSNRPMDLIHLDGVNNVKIFDINELRKNNTNSVKYEILRKNPVGTYPGIFPWNLRRFVIEKAAQDGFDYIIYTDADLVFRDDINPSDFVKILKSRYSPNKVKSNVHIFQYSVDSTSEVFSLHDKYLKNLDYDFTNKDLNTVDGPVMVFMGETNKDILKLVNVWHDITNFGYEKKLGFGYDNFFIANLSFVIPMSDFKLESEDFPFYPNHIFEDRYSSDYVVKEGEFDYNYDSNNLTLSSQQISDTSPSSKKDLNEILTKYSCRKSKNGFSTLIEDYLIYIENDDPNILEIGVGTVDLNPPSGRNYVPENMYSWKQENPNYEPGNSLRSFREFMNTGFFYGIDIQKDCEINEEKIKTFIFDSRYPNKKEESLKDLEFDLIIDDSDKDVNIRIITFNNFYNSLKNEGYYVIEDLLELELLESYFSYHRIPYLIVDKFMFINKNNNFDLINKKKPTTYPKQSPNLNGNEIIDYVSIINETPKFSINENILADKGFYINLKSSVERKDKVENLIIENNINGLVRFGALTDEMIQYSCTKSHMGVFEIALSNNLETIFVAEDDFDVPNTLYSPNTDTIYFKDKIKDIKNDLDNLEWDVFLFGCNPKSHLIPITKNVAVVNKSTGAWAYLIKKRAYKYLLENLKYKRDYIAIDDYLPMLNDLGFTTLTSIPMSIGHSVGFVSTLQPRGPVNYTDWINGNYHKFLYDNYKTPDFTDNTLEKKLTIVITGHFVENFTFYLNYLLYSLPENLRKCKILLNYDETGTNDIGKSKIELGAFFRDVQSDLNVFISYSNGGLISSVKNVIDKIKTPYFLFLEHDWVFLKKDSIDFINLLDSFDKYNFVNAVWFSKDDNSLRGIEITEDFNGSTTPFQKEERIKDVNLLTTCRWSNNPAVFRLSKFNNWFYNIINNEYVGVINQHSQNVEETMIPFYRNEIKNKGWNNIKDDWGTYLYGNIGEGPYVGHTDASKRYQGNNKSTPEINGEIYIQNNPL